MKKILSFFGSLSLIMVGASTVIACGTGQQTSEAKVNLAVAVPTQRIADFDHDEITDEEILEMAKQTNPDLNLDEVELSHNPSTQADEEFIPNEAILTVKENSEVYNPGSVMVYFTDPTHPRLGLVNVLKVTDLGEMLFSASDQRPPLEDIRRRLQELNPALEMEYIELSFNSSNAEGGTINLQLVQNHHYYIGENEDYTLTYHKQTSLLDLDKVIQTPHLGDVDFYDAWDDLKLIKIISDLNPYLEVSQVKITSKSRDFAGHVRLTVIEDSTKYNPGFVDLTFNSQVNSALEMVLTNRNLGIFDDEPTDEEILETIKRMNPLVDLDEIYIASNIKNKVIIREKFGSFKYWQAKIELSYAVKNRPYLQNIWNAILTTDLGELNVETNSQQVILAKVKELNPWLDLVNLGVEQLEVLQHRNGFATIKVIDNSRIYSAGSVEVSYINQNKISLSDVLTVAPIRNTMIGVDSLTAEVNDPETVLKNLKYFNLNLDTDEVIVESMEVRPILGTDPLVAQLYVNLNVKQDSQIYRTDEASIQRIFNLFKNATLADLIVNTDLGTFKSVPTYSQLANLIFQRNRITNNLIIFLLQLHLVHDGNGEVIMSVSFPGYEILKGTARLTYTLETNDENNNEESFY